MWGPVPSRRLRETTASAEAVAHRNDLPEADTKALLHPSLIIPRRIPHHVIGSAALLLPLAREAAVKKGVEPFTYADPTTGEARDQAKRIVELAKAKQDRGEVDFCMIFAGETTVTVIGDGLGGRCQEMAVAALGSLEETRGLAAFLPPEPTVAMVRPPLLAGSLMAKRPPRDSPLPRLLNRTMPSTS